MAAPAVLIDWYQVSADLPSFVGNATYRGEQLLMWFPYDPSGVLTEPVGIYHGRFDSLPSNPGVLTCPGRGDARGQASRRGPSSQHHRRPVRECSLQYLGPYRPVLVRTASAATGVAAASCLADRPEGIRPARRLIET